MKTATLKDSAGGDVLKSGGYGYDAAGSPADNPNQIVSRGLAGRTMRFSGTTGEPGEVTVSGRTDSFRR